MELLASRGFRGITLIPNIIMGCILLLDTFINHYHNIFLQHSNVFPRFKKNYSEKVVSKRFTF